MPTTVTRRSQLIPLEKKPSVDPQLASKIVKDFLKPLFDDGRLKKRMEKSNSSVLGEVKLSELLSK
jgi:hypothetical protein